MVALLGVIALQLFLASGSRPQDRWEYRDRTADLVDVPSTLALFGRSGWEVITVSEQTGLAGTSRRLWFKRRIHRSNSALDQATGIGPWLGSSR